MRAQRTLAMATACTHRVATVTAMVFCHCVQALALRHFPLSKRGSPKDGFDTRKGAYPVAWRGMALSPPLGTEEQCSRLSNPRDLSCLNKI